MLLCKVSSGHQSHRAQHILIMRCISKLGGYPASTRKIHQGVFQDIRAFPFFLSFHGCELKMLEQYILHLRQISCGAQPISQLHKFKPCVTLASETKVQTKQKTGKNIFAPFLLNCFGAPGVPGQGCGSREAERANVVPYNRSCRGAVHLNPTDGRLVWAGRLSELLPRLGF